MLSSKVLRVLKAVPWHRAIRLVRTVTVGAWAGASRWLAQLSRHTLVNMASVGSLTCY